MSLRDYPKEEYDLNELRNMKLLKDSWKVNALKLNNCYNCWGNYEDYMSCDDTSWNSAIEIDSVKELWKLDDLNELINFYFFIERDNYECKECNGIGYNKSTKEIYDSWFDWQNSLTQDEVDELWKQKRLFQFKQKPTAEQVNDTNKTKFIHDSINHYICTDVRAKRLGVYGTCSECKGKGVIYTEPQGHLSLQMWFIHPRKGASRGVILKRIESEDELQIVIEYLKQAKERMLEKFKLL